jgi:hypothetical protein
MTATQKSDGAANPLAPAMTHTMQYSTQAMRMLSDCQGKYAAFVSKRLSEDLAMPSRLAECKSPMEVIDVWADFYSTAMGQYADQVRTMTELGQKAVEDTVREAELEVSDMAKAAGEAIKPLAVDGADDSAKVNPKAA